MATRKGRLFKDPCFVADNCAAVRAAAQLSILINNIQTYGRAFDNVRPQFVQKTLVCDGAAAYVRDLNDWFAFDCANGEKDRAELPTKIRLKYARGQRSPVLSVDWDNVVIVPANSFMSPPQNEIIDRMTTQREIARALGQNMNALKVASAIIYNDSDLTAQVDAAERDRLEGKATVKIYNKNGLPVDIVKFGTDAVSHLTELSQLWKDTNEELNALTGRVSVGEKNERRINEEISVIEQNACVAVDVIVNSANAYCKQYDVPAIFARGVGIVQTPAGAPVQATEQPNEGEGDSGGNKGLSTIFKRFRAK